MVKKAKKPWPTKDVMNQIYEKHLWGGLDFDFYSGSGSHNSKIIDSYIVAVVKFLSSFNPLLVVCDLGCGDFNIGKHFIKHAKKYIAVDIVEPLIKRNKQLFKHDHLEFHCLDISKDNMPEGDCVILRQVLQHLSNTEIEKITKKLYAYKYIILTEHIPTGLFTPNKDIISGQGNRTKFNSGVNLAKTPFNFKFKEERIINNYILEDKKSQIVTTLYKVF
ncbi:SAM-dependent methyltransferase [Seonamhaeicola sp. S2-3]|uniref:class I SAM-dependent methyltransferase n=1 Tax=Seonamhaeicola sp. S2-3 TaxID=1936081 RepID=UPI00097289AE|nr:class I SAM-dependent methyltransferase [Seonamhaeicola sp. S2-3]APY11303.1 SAM-dependent methyltransferase [Seonamhaeicola sp. S2-3]